MIDPMIFWIMRDESSQESLMVTDALDSETTFCASQIWVYMLQVIPLLPPADMNLVK